MWCKVWCKRFLGIKKSHKYGKYCLNWRGLPEEKIGLLGCFKPHSTVLRYIKKWCVVAILWWECGVKMRQISVKRAKLEKNRFSILSDDKNTCYICGSHNNLTWHEVFEGRNRNLSMKYGCCLRLCIYCHNAIQYNDDFYKKLMIDKFNQIYDEDFQSVFKTKIK